MNTKSSIFYLIMIVALAILIAKVLNWFLHFDTEVNRIINIIMFGFIAMIYLLQVKSTKHIYLKYLFLISSTSIVLCLFFYHNNLVAYLLIMLILIPWAIQKFYYKEVFYI
jgi:hypothetical protein